MTTTEPLSFTVTLPRTLFAELEKDRERLEIMIERENKIAEAVGNKTMWDRGHIDYCRQRGYL